MFEIGPLTAKKTSRKSEYRGGVFEYKTVGCLSTGVGI